MSAFGHNRERMVRDLLLSEDWWAQRAPASLGDVDVFACKPGRVLFAEVKGTAAGPYHSFGPKDRADLLFAAKLGGAEAWLCWWPPRAKPTWIPASEWPTAKAAA